MGAQPSAACGVLAGGREDGYTMIRNCNNVAGLIIMTVFHNRADARPANALPIFVISLKRRTDRLRHMQALLAAHGLEAEFIEAVDGAALTAEQRRLYDRRRALSVYGAEMSDAELGCHLSHLKAHQAIVDRGLDLALVLEDDIECDADFREVLEGVAAAPRREWLVLRLQSVKGGVIAGDRPATRGEPCAQVRGRTVSRLRSGVVGGCAYMIRREGAERMLRYAGRPFMPIDQAMDRYWENGIVPYVLRPFPVRQSPGIRSEIAERKTETTICPYLTVVRRVRRAADGVNKRVFGFLRLGGWRRFAAPGAVAPVRRPRPAWLPSRA